jgi:prepilin-type N-terminal cleavage/methylation domain-containing protein
MGYKTIDSKKSRAAMTLPEMMIAIGIGSIVFLALASLTLYSARSFSSMVNYSELNRNSRMGLDKMTRDIRESRGLTDRTPTSLSFRMDSAGNTNMSLIWDKINQTVTQVITSGTNTVTEILLTDCTYWTNQIFQNNTVSNSFDPVSTTSVSMTKLIQLNWTCSENRVNTTNSESVQSMRIVIRKKS